MKKEEIAQVAERAAWTEDDVRKRARVLMMERGVLDPGQYQSTLPEEPRIPGPVDRMYEVGDYTGLLTGDADFAAEAAEKLIRHEYEWADERRYFKRGQPEVKVSTVAVYDAAEMAEYRAAKSKFEKLKKEDDRLRKEYEESREAMDQAVEDAEAEAYEARQRLASLQTVKDTYDEYVGLAGEGAARIFLRKAFTNDVLIQDAEDYFGVRMSEPAEVKA